MPLSNRVCFLVNLRDGLTCQRCGKQPQAPTDYHKGFEYHHRQPRSAGGPDTADNLVLLCHECHEQGHRHPVQANGALETLNLQPPERFACHACQQLLCSETVEMNCGWYRCGFCQAQVPLYHHFFGDESRPAEGSVAER